MDLQSYAAIAEIFGAVTIVLGAVFALVQLAEYRRRRKNQVAAELCRKFAEAEVGRAVTLVKRLPDGISLQALRSMDSEYEESVLIVSMAFETMGLLVHKNIASFRLIQQLTGGLLVVMWRKSRVWVEQSREDQDNPRFAEWFQWLTERIEDSEPDVPAYIQFRDWRHKKR